MKPAMITNLENGVYTLYFAGIEPKACQSVRRGETKYTDKER